MAVRQTVSAGYVNARPILMGLLYKKVYIFLAVISIIYASGLHFCSKLAPLIEQQRLTSPDGSADAVLATKDTFAFDCAPAIVLILKHGDMDLDEKQEVLWGCRVQGLEMFWESPRQLVVRYEGLRVDYFRNFCGYLDENHDYREVAVKLKEIGTGSPAEP